MDEVSATSAELASFAPLVHGFLAFWGFLDCFLGFRIFRMTVSILVAFAGAAIGVSLAMEYFPESLAALAGFAFAGLVIGALLAWYVYKLGIFVLGFCFGAILVAPFTGMVEQVPEWAVTAGAGLIAGILAVLLINLMVMAATALTGAFRLVYGIAFFLGGPSLLVAVEQPDDLMPVIRQAPLLFILTLLLGAIGFYVQRSSSEKDKKAGKEE